MDNDKIIFLDVDGVLNSSNWAEKMFKEEGIRVYSENLLDDHALRLLKALVDKTGAKLILSSSWRKIPSCKEALSVQLGHYGMTIYDETPYVGGIRGDDITAWFNRHPGEYRYVILDDDSDMGEHLPHLVNTSFYIGLTLSDVNRSIALLNDI